MGIAYNEEVASTVATVTGHLKELILKSSDWAHLQLATGTQNTTLAAPAAPNDVSISTNATIPSGSVITIWASSSMNGAATPESRVTTGVSGAGPYTVTFSRPLVGNYSSTHAVGVGSYVKATTTRGAQMVVDLQDTAITAQRMQVAAYRTHDGTTAVDKVTRYLYWKSAVGATTDILHLVVSAGKEHLFFSVEGPRMGETNAESGNGSMRQFFAFSDIAPYFNSSYDAVPAVCLIANKDAGYNVSPWGIAHSRDVYVSRNATNDLSWARASLMTLGNPSHGTSTQISTHMSVSLDGSYLMMPWVVFEDAKGIRGSLTRFFYGGALAVSIGGDPLPGSTGLDVSYGGITYRSLLPTKGAGASNNLVVSYGFGAFYNTSGANPGPLLFVPKV